MIYTAEHMVIIDNMVYCPTKPYPYQRDFVTEVEYIKSYKEYMSSCVKAQDQQKGLQLIVGPNRNGFIGVRDNYSYAVGRYNFKVENGIAVLEDQKPLPDLGKGSDAKD